MRSEEEIRTLIEHYESELPYHDGGKHYFEIKAIVKYLKWVLEDENRD